jgi:predicted nucleic acid-binding protein
MLSFCPIQCETSCILKHYRKKCTIVFDEYANTRCSAKKTEQIRRFTKQKSIDIIINEVEIANVTQEIFLANDSNKLQLIDMLQKCLVQPNFVVKQAKDDADTLIVNTAIDLPASAATVIIGEDVDLLVILVATAPYERNIYLPKPAKQNVAHNVYSCVQEELTQIILFAHSFSGYDTTSAIYGKCKTKCLKLIQKRKDFHQLVNVFKNSSSN